MRKHKFNAKKTVVDGIKFASKMEAKRYLQLKLLERAGKIKGLRLQVPFKLQDSFRYRGDLIREIKYTPDFVYYDNDLCETVVEEVKGKITVDYTIRKKLFLKKYGDNYYFLETRSV